MDKQPPIVIIDDNVDDIDMLVKAYKTLPYKNKLLTFDDSITAYQYLIPNSVAPLLVISDIFMPKINGFELRENVQQHPLFPGKVPFVFLTGVAELPDTNNESIDRQIFFEKKSDFTELTETLDTIISCHSITAQV